MVDRSPRISVNKLGEYLVQADSSRRRKIIQDQKLPSIGRKVGAYDEAKRAIVNALLGVDAPPLLQQATTLASDKRGSPKAVSNRENSALAIETFINILPKLPQDVRYVVAPQRGASLMIAGVEVKIVPDVLIHAERRGIPVIGAVKLHFPKDDDRALGAPGSQFVAVLINQWLAGLTSNRRRPAPDLCFSVDVFRQTVVAAPTSQQRRLEKIQDGCAEIAARWPQL